MNKSREGAEWTFSWPELGIALRVFGVRESRDDDLIGQVEPFELVADELKPLAGPTRANLSGARGKTELANLLSRRRPMEDREGWGDIVETVAAHVWRDYRQGAPIVDLASVSAHDVLPYLMRPYLPLHEVTVLYGDGASGKSVFAALLALAVRTGAPVPHAAPATASGNVLYLDYETYDNSQSRRFRRIAAGLGSEFDGGIYYRRCERPIADDGPMLAAQVARYNVQLVVVDSLAWACGGDPTDPQVAIRSIGAIRALGATALVIAHSPKGERQEKGKRSIFGSAFFEFGPRSAWEVRADRDGGTLRQAIYHRKANDDELLGYPLGQVIRFDREDQSIRFSAASLAADDDLSSGASHTARIRRVLAEARQPVTVAEISEATDLKDNMVRALLGRMDTDVVQVGSGKIHQWALRTTDTPPSSLGPTGASQTSGEGWEECARCHRVREPERYNDAGASLCRACA